MLVLLQGGGVAIGPNGECWDCPISFREALGLVAVVLASIALGIILRRNDKRYVQIVGNCFLIFGALEIFVLNHAGRNWGIIRSLHPVEFYNRDTVSFFSLVIAMVGAGSVIYFRRRPQKQSRETG